MNKGQEPIQPCRKKHRVDAVCSLKLVSLLSLPGQITFSISQYLWVFTEENFLLPLLQTPATSPGCLQALLVTNLGLPTILSGFDNSLEQLAKLRKLLCLQLPVYYKGYKHPDEELHRVRSRRVPTSRYFGYEGKVKS